MCTNYVIQSRYTHHIATMSTSAMSDTALAPSSRRGKAAGLKVWDYWLTKVRKTQPIDQLTATYVEEENMNEMVYTFAMWCAKTPIPKYRDANLESTQTSPTYLVPSALEKYIEKGVTLLKERFPDHSAWKEDGWLKSITGEKFIGLCTRFQFNKTDTFGENDKRPLFTLINQGSITKGDHWLHHCDLSTVCKNMMASASATNSSARPFQKRAEIVLVKLACGRPGEVKFQQFTEWVFLPYFQMLDPGWTEMKTLEKYSSPMAPSKFGYACDPYHALGSFWCCENGLFRSDSDEELKYFVFMDLHSMRDDKVSTNMTKLLRKHLPDEVPKDELKSFSAKSARIGAINELAIHRDIGYYESHARTGHSTGSNQDAYFDRKVIGNTIPGGYCLGGWSDVRSRKSLPNFECLGTHVGSDVTRFIDGMFVVSIDLFSANAPLYPVLRACCASLVMYHRQVGKDLGHTNLLYSKVRQCAINVNIQDSNAGSVDPELVLNFWSERIERNFWTQNPDVAPLTDKSTLVDFTATMNKMASNLQTITVQMADLQQKSQDSNALIAAQSATINKQQAELVQLRQEVANANRSSDAVKKRLTSVFRSPAKESNHDEVLVPSPMSAAMSSSGGSTHKSPPTVSYGSAGGTKRGAPDDATTNKDNSDGNNEDTQGSAKRSKPPSKLHFGAEAEDTSTASNKGLDMYHLISNMYDQGMFKNRDNDFKFINLPKPICVQDKAKYNHCLDLLDLCVTQEDKDKLRTEMEREDLLKLSRKISDDALFKIAQCLNEPTDKRLSKAKPTYLALGRRVSQYKSWLKKMSGDNTMRDRSEVGTPKGNHAVTNFFTKK